MVCVLTAVITTKRARPEDMTSKKTQEIAARSSKAVHLTSGETLSIINTFGAQVVAVWAFVPTDISEFMSMEHSRLHAKSSRPERDTVFYTNLHVPILKMTADTSPGVHDWYLAACNQQRYDLLGHSEPHANCTDNMHSALRDAGYEVPYVPCPLNLFENVPVLFGNTMDIKEPVSMPGDYVSFSVLRDCLVVLSACPQDIAMTNGPDHVPRSIKYEVHAAIAG